MGTGIWAQLQLFLPHHTHAILMNHHCDQQGPLVATYTDIHRHPAGKVDTLRLVGATITIVYITPTHTKVMAQCGAHNAPLLADPRWGIPPHMRHENGTYSAGAQGHRHSIEGLSTPAPPARLNKHGAPNNRDTKREEPTPLGQGWAQPTIFQLAPNGHKQATCTV